MISSASALKAAKASVDLKKSHGCDIELIGLEQARRIEPAIEQMPGRYVAAMYSPRDEVADAREFTSGLADWLSNNQGVSVRLDTMISDLIAKDSRIVGVVADEQRYSFGAVVVCTGANSPDLLRPLGINLPVYPVRGYSITLPPTAGSPSVNITDQSNRIVFSRIDSGIRIAGFADIIGFRDKNDGRRTRMLIDGARNVAPGAANYEIEHRHEWAGSRPMTPTGIPITGLTRIAGLFVNTGHGMLGWTLATATAFNVAEAVQKFAPVKRVAA